MTIRLALTALATLLALLGGTAAATSPPARVTAMNVPCCK